MINDRGGLAGLSSQPLKGGNAMYLLVDVLEQTELLPELLEEFVKIGVTGTTVLDSIGMGRILLEADTSVPVLDTIKGALAKGKPSNKTIFAVIDEKETLRKAIDVIRSVCGNLQEPGKGILFTIPVDFVEGLK
jgi:nitrogen regulatory protein PII